MSRKIVLSLCVALAVFAFGTMTVGSASGANLVVIQPKEGMLAIYGYPGANSLIEAKEAPVGQGLGRNFGFGQNMLFQAGGGKGKPLFFEFEFGGKLFKSESCDSFIGGTLMSNKTGKNNPLSFGIEFADFQCNKSGEATKEVLTSAYADTTDQKWITEICSPAAAASCKADPVIAGEEGQVKIEHVAITVGPGLTVQGVVYGKWKNGAAGKPPCIEIKKSPSAEALQNLVVTQSAAGITTGTGIKTVGGEACLVSANNDWYNQFTNGITERTEPAIEILNE
jgi:hypothetical protein